jgi:hypothetical protein
MPVDPSRVGIRRGEQLDDDLGAERELHAGLDHPAEALAHPAARVRRSFDQQRALGELDRAQRVEPHTVGRLVNDEGKLGLYSRPDVIELVAHGSVDPLLSWRLR